MLRDDDEEAEYLLRVLHSQRRKKREEAWLVTKTYFTFMLLQDHKVWGDQSPLPLFQFEEKGVLSVRNQRRPDEDASSKQFRTTNEKHHHQRMLCHSWLLLFSPELPADHRPWSSKNNEETSYPLKQETWANVCLSLLIQQHYIIHEKGVSSCLDNDESMKLEIGRHGDHHPKNVL